MCDIYKRVNGIIEHITCYIKRTKPRFFKDLCQMQGEVRLAQRDSRGQSGHVGFSARQTLALNDSVILGSAVVSTAVFGVSPKTFEF
jgi:hypothetical protein